MFNLKQSAKQLLTSFSIALVLGAPAKAAEYAPINLDHYVNRTPASNELTASPRKGSSFDEIGGAEVRLSHIERSGKAEVAVGLVGKQPTAVKGISVGFSDVKALHFYHGILRGVSRSGSFVAKYVVHYRSGKIQEIPLVAGQTIGSALVAQGLSNASAIQAVVDGEPRNSFIYHLIWKNPFPKDRIVSLDLIAVNPSVVVSLSALTAELAPPARTSSALMKRYESLIKLHREFRRLGDSASISILNNDYSLSAKKALKEVISSSDAGSTETVSLKKMIRDSINSRQPESREFRLRLSNLYNKRNSLQERLTQFIRSQ